MTANPCTRLEHLSWKRLDIQGRDAALLCVWVRVCVPEIQKALQHVVTTKKAGGMAPLSLAMPTKLWDRGDWSDGAITLYLPGGQKPYPPCL